MLRQQHLLHLRTDYHGVCLLEFLLSEAFKLRNVFVQLNEIWPTPALELPNLIEVVSDVAECLWVLKLKVIRQVEVSEE